MRRLRTAVALAAAAALMAGMAACSSSSSSSDANDDAESPASEASEESGETTEGGGLTGELVVLAAASLTDAFEDLGAQLEAANPELSVSFSFAASSALAEQVNAGSPADVLATASSATMGLVGDLAVDPADFATNTLVIVTPPDNPGGVTGIADFANPELRLAVCAEEVPCGALSAEIFAALGLTPAVDTYAADVRAALTLAEQGEVDATLVYKTDALSAGDRVATIDFPEATAEVNDYPIAVLTGAPNPDAAAAFVSLVMSPEGRAVLAAAGFSPPQ